MGFLDRFRRASLFCFDGTRIYVNDLQTARLWYERVFAIKFYEERSDDGSPYLTTHAPGEEPGPQLNLIPRSGGRDSMDERLTPIIFAVNLEKAKTYLEQQGVFGNAMLDDGTGAKYFEIHDLENNTVEICEYD